MSIAVANRYARALADVCGKEGNYRPVLRELEDFAATSRASADLREVFDTPAVPLPEKVKVLEAIASRLGASQITRNFLRVLLTHYRMGMLDEVREAFQRISNDRLGVVLVKVLSASALADAERRALRARFARLTQKRVELEFRLDPALLGGVVAQIGSTVYDGSVRGHLERLRQQLVGGR
jgi:F-type H+-transporting ATPase subunit delta